MTLPIGQAEVWFLTGSQSLYGPDTLDLVAQQSRQVAGALADGKINFIVECSPLLGPQLMDVAEQVLAGDDVEPRILTEETTFTPEQAKAALPNRKY